MPYDAHPAPWRVFLTKRGKVLVDKVKRLVNNNNQLITMTYSGLKKVISIDNTNGCDGVNDSH